MRGILFGSMVLIGLYVLVQEGVADRIGPLADIPAAIARRFIDPAIPALGSAGMISSQAPAPEPDQPAAPDYPDPSQPAPPSL